MATNKKDTGYKPMQEKIPEHFLQTGFLFIVRILAIKPIIAYFVNRQLQTSLKL
jgi:hypothetical protein